MNRSRRKKSRFWLIYTIVTAVLLIAVAAGLVLFYDFIDAFEESQPQSPSEAAKLYASALSKEKVEELMRSHAASLEPAQGEGEYTEKIITALADAWDTDSMFCKRLGDLGSDDAPVYSVISKGRELLRLTLEKKPTGRYGFDAWCVSRTEAVIEGVSIYSVTVPADAVVFVNGKELDKSFITETGILYSFKEFEKNAEGLPTAVRYETELLGEKPSLSVKLGDRELKVSYDDNGFTAEYPEDLLYSCTLKVPSGSVITSNGVDLSSYAEKTVESAFGGLIAEGLTVPSFDVYTIRELYAPIDNVNVSLNGTALQFEESTDGKVQSITVDIGSVSDETVAAFADTFTRAYFHYTSSGYRNTAENLAAALSYVLNGSELYTRIRDSKVGYDFVTPVTSQVYNRLEVVRMYRLEDSSYVVKLAFDVDQQIYSVSRSYKGEISLHIVNVGTYKIANMVIENE